MKKILAIAHSYYMLLTLIQMRTTIYQKEHMDIVLSDASKNSERIYKNLKGSNIFNNCYFYRIQDIAWEKGERALKKIWLSFKNIANAKEVVQKAIHVNLDNKYDIMLVYVDGRFEEQVFFKAIKKDNPNACCELYEEGYVSYFSSRGVLEHKLTFASLMFGVMKISHKRNALISNNIRKAWYFHPTLVQYSPKFDIEKIPEFDKENIEMIEKINMVFHYMPEKTSRYKIVFLEGCSYTDFAQTDDMELLAQLTEWVGKEDILVKLHPRTKENRFAERGYQTNKTNVPLELMIMNKEYEGSIFVTVESGSPLSCLLNLKSKNKIILLQKCTKYPNRSMKNPHFVRLIDELSEHYAKGQLIIPENIDEFKRAIWEMSEKLKDKMVRS